MGSLTPIMVNPNAYADPPWFFWAGMASMVLPLTLMGVLLLNGMWGAVRTMQGRPFRYILIGSWVDNFLKDRK